MFYAGEQRSIMDMLFPDDQKYQAVLEKIAEFCEREILPGARNIDQEEIFPRENLRKVSEKGIFSFPFPPDYGGAGLPYPVFIASIEMLAKACANTSLHVSIQGMICEGIRTFGNEGQKKRLLKEKGLVEGKSLIAFALTEPCCGSDAGAIQTTAARSGNSFVLNGSKTLITNPGEADFTLVFARSEKGVSAFLVPAGTPGFGVMKTIPKLGFRGNRLAAIHLKDCAVPDDHLLGEDGKGLEYAKQMLNSGRMTISAIGVGIAQAAYEKSIVYSKKRRAFGESISHFQLIQQKLSDMATEISAARLLVYYAAHLRDRGRDIALEASKAKLFASEMALRVCDHAIQIHGGYGYTDGSDVHRHWRDARMLTIGEGTSDMLRLLIAHLSLKDGG
jgi:alkylation response protein AidB-like acyl-CoA dehydrogenase